MIRAYNDGIPSNGNPVPDGAVMANVEWAKKAVKGPPYSLTAPGPLQEAPFMVKDSKRFASTGDGGYGSGAWNAFGDAPDFAKRCHACHSIAKARDVVLTELAQT
jgi:Cytochrome P460